MASSVRPGILCVAGALLSAAVATAWSGGPESSTAAPGAAGANAAGTIAVLVWQPFGFDDAYSWMAGAGVFYERRVALGVPLVLEARAAACAQEPLVSGFDRSFTLLAGACAGWELLRRSGGDLEFSLVPYAGYFQYWRWLPHEGEEYVSSRPIVVLGIGLDLAIGKRVLCGIAAEPMLILDRTPLFSLGQVQKVGVRF
jgi:hypothetical protein